MRAALRKAIDEIVFKGRTQRDAAKEAGMNETALGRALQKPHVAEHVETMKAQALIDATKLRGLAKAMAIQTGIDLMRSSTSDAVKARMVEFFAGEIKQGTQVNVNIGAASGGYEFLRPGQRIIDITPIDSAASDSPSGDIDGQAIDNDGE